MTFPTKVHWKKVVSIFKMFISPKMVCLCYGIAAFSYFFVHNDLMTYFKNDFLCYEYRKELVPLSAKFAKKCQIIILLKFWEGWN